LTFNTPFDNNPALWILKPPLFSYNEHILKET
jgi:hypothetical protein